MAETRANQRLRQELRAINFRLNSTLQRLATQHGVVIIAGTSHDHETFENCGPIFFPESRFSVDHRKLTTAYCVNEYVKTSYGSRYPVYQLGGISFSVMVCSDALDLNIFFEPFANASAMPHLVPTLVFVPSFFVPDKQGSEDVHYMRMACRQLSEAADLIVVFCNQAQDQLRYGVFFGGQELKGTTGHGAHVVEIERHDLTEIRRNASGVWSQISKLLSGPKRRESRKSSRRLDA